MLHRGSEPPAPAAAVRQSGRLAPGAFRMTAKDVRKPDRRLPVGKTFFRRGPLARFRPAATGLSLSTPEPNMSVHPASGRRVGQPLQVTPASAGPVRVLALGLPATNRRQAAEDGRQGERLAVLPIRLGSTGLGPQPKRPGECPAGAVRCAASLNHAGGGTGNVRPGSAMLSTGREAKALPSRTDTAAPCCRQTASDGRHV